MRVAMPPRLRRSRAEGHLEAHAVLYEYVSRTDPLFPPTGAIDHRPLNGGCLAPGRAALRCRHERPSRLLMYFRADFNHLVYFFSIFYFRIVVIRVFLI